MKGVVYGTQIYIFPANLRRSTHIISKLGFFSKYFGRIIFESARNCQIFIIFVQFPILAVREDAQQISGFLVVEPLKVCWRGGGLQPPEPLGTTSFFVHES